MEKWQLIANETDMRTCRSVQSGQGVTYFRKTSLQMIQIYKLKNIHILDDKKKF